VHLKKTITSHQLNRISNEIACAMERRGKAVHVQSQNLYVVEPYFNVFKDLVLMCIKSSIY